MMFELNTSGEVYVWHRLFLLLSMERTTAFLLDLEFAPLEHVEVIREVSRDFVRQFCDIELKLFEAYSISSVGKQLYDETYAELVARIGADATAAFCRWGNLLTLDPLLKQRLLSIWVFTLAKLIKDKSGLMAQLPAELQQKALMIKAVILRHERELAGIREALRILETIPKDEWDQEAYRIYNGSQRADLTDVENIISPLDTLYSHMNSFKIRTAWRQIKLVLNDAEFDAFTSWVAGQKYLKPPNRMNQYLKPPNQMSIFDSISAPELAALLQQIAKG